MHLPPPGLKKTAPLHRTEPPRLPEDPLDKAADHREEHEHGKAGKVLLGLGMLAGGLASSVGTAYAADVAQVQMQPAEPSQDASLHEQMLRAFDQHGDLYKRTLGFKSDLTPSEALKRLQDRAAVYVHMDGGGTEKLKSVQDLETLDTLEGQQLHPNLPADLVRSLRDLEQGRGPHDGMFKPNGDEVSAFDAFRILSSPRDGAGRAAFLTGLAGMTVGLAMVGGGALMMTRGLVPAMKGRNQNYMWAAAAGVVAIGALSGAVVGQANYQAAFPKTLEVKNGTDSHLAVRELTDVIEQSQWLQEQATHPFTPEQQREVAKYWDEHGGMYKSGLGHGRLSPSDALKRLEEGKGIEVPDPVHPGQRITLPSLRHLQEYDTVHGLGINPVVSQDEMSSMRYLAQNGEFFKGDKKMSGYEALDFMLRQRQSQGVRLNGKTYTLAGLREAQELNALKGDLKNTILPENEFTAMRYFDGAFRNGDKAIDAFEALQNMHNGKPVGTELYGRSARVESATDVHELYSLEVSGKNTILPQQQYDLLQYWQQHGGYKDGRAYEALQQLQKHGSFDIRSAGRWAPASSYQDMIDLAAFEGQDNPFPDTVPRELRDRLEYFQGTSPLAFRVGNREGRAYEGYRQLRDGNGVEVKAGGVWNLVLDGQDLHELDAMLGRRVNDILPKSQYDLLHHLGDESRPEGLTHGGQRLNSYQALQAFQGHQDVTYDFVGGDFAETLHVPVGGLDKLADAKLRRDNQKEYDKYRYSVPEFRDKMERQESQLPSLAQSDLEQGQSHLHTGQNDLSRGESHKSDAESDLSRARSDKSWAEGRLIMAYSMPSEVAVTKYRTVTNSDGTTSQESYTDYEHNYARDAAIASAQSDVWAAERRISSAQSEIREAEQEIARAQEEIRQAQREISESEEILRIVSQLHSTLGSVDEGNISAQLTKLRSQVARMKDLAHTASLEANLIREGKLIQNQQTRPARPPGWEVPTPLAQQ